METQMLMRGVRDDLSPMMNAYDWRRDAGIASPTLGGGEIIGGGRGEEGG